MKLRDVFRRGPARPAVYHASDGASWVLDWVARYLAAELDAQGVPSVLTTAPWDLKGQIIHFHDRYTYFNGPHDRLHPSNHLFMTWFHGDPADPLMTPVFAQMHAAVPHLDKIVVSCSATHQHALDGGLPGDKMVQIPLGVDLDLFVPPEPGAREEGRAALGVPDDAVCIGSFQKDGVGWGEGSEPKLVKGPDVFLETLAQLKPYVPNLFVLLTGPARGYVRAGLARLGIPYAHHHLDDYREIVAYYHALDLYLIASRVEGGPQALLESWATGVPLVSTRMGMPADLIADGDNGLLAEVEDAAGLAEGAAALLDDADLRAHCQTQALDDVRQYAWPVIARRYADELYRPLLERTGA
ncbi:glycosyltransferase family 4 protein [Aggregatilinea lenta]|uniref:glycosyltransferase family 4 protein n=1 Tax=Aggregatilinea lenta TaxID=913108 RepID=UPI001EE82579|nr:glycosyltransferase family 4 protein [Aggregatilinea lenta]